MSSYFPRVPTRLLIKFPTGFHGRKSRKPPILHSDTHTPSHPPNVMTASLKVTSCCFVQ